MAGRGSRVSHNPVTPTRSRNDDHFSSSSPAAPMGTPSTNEGGTQPQLHNSRPTENPWPEIQKIANDFMLCYHGNLAPLRRQAHQERLGLFGHLDSVQKVVQEIWRKELRGRPAQQLARLRERRLRYEELERRWTDCETMLLEWCANVLLAQGVKGEVPLPRSDEDTPGVLFGVKPNIEELDPNTQIRAELYQRREALRDTKTQWEDLSAFMKNIEDATPERTRSIACQIIICKEKCQKEQEEIENLEAMIYEDGDGDMDSGGSFMS